MGAVVVLVARQRLAEVFELIRQVQPTPKPQTTRQGPQTARGARRDLPDVVHRVPLGGQLLHEASHADRLAHTARAGDEPEPADLQPQMQAMTRLALTLGVEHRVGVGVLAERHAGEPEVRL